MPGRSARASVGGTLAEVLRDDLVERGDRQGLQLETLEVPSYDLQESRSLETVETQRQNQPNRHVGQPPDRKGDRSARRRIEPLDVVDREHDLSIGGQPANE